jgi:hypothetical protein
MLAAATDATDGFITRTEIPAFLAEYGYPISHSTIDKLSMPSRGRNDGPPCEGAWGNRHLYRPKRVLAWARQRFKANRSANMADDSPARIAERDHKEAHTKAKKPRR